MADAILPANAADMCASEVLAAEYLLTLAERDGNVLTHPAFFHITGRPGSNVVKVPHLGYGADIMSADTPGNEHTNTTFGDSSTQVTLANRVLMYGSHVLAKFMTDGRFSEQMLAQFLAVVKAQTLIDLVANVADGFTNIAGTTLVDLTWDDVLTGKAFLGSANAGGRILGLVHPQQWSDLEVDALSAGMSLAMSNGGGIINAGLESYKGTHLGVDWFTSSRVPASGGNRLGSLMTVGAVAWADAEYDDEGDPNILNLGSAQLERARKGTYSITHWVHRTAMGATLAIDAAGVTLRSDD